MTCGFIRDIRGPPGNIRDIDIKCCDRYSILQGKFCLKGWYILCRSSRGKRATRNGYPNQCKTSGPGGAGASRSGY